MTCRPHELARPFTQRNIERLPDEAVGVYGLWFGQICLYVGKAERQPMKVRLLNHFNNCHNPDLKNWLNAYSKDIVFVAKTIDDRSRIHWAERQYISRFVPRTNKTR